MSWKFSTRLLHSNRLDSIEHGSIHKPVHSCVSFGYKQAEDLIDVFQNKKKGYAYGRQANPTTTALEKKISCAEDATNTLCFSSGMAAISAMCFALLKKDDHIVCSQFIFGNTNSLFRSFERIGVRTTFVDATHIRNVEKATEKKTKLIFVETIANPKTQVADLFAIGDFCEKKNLIYVVDNTLTSPYLFQPKQAKATFSLNSLTKFFGGHANALGGSLSELGNYNWKKMENILDLYKKDSPEKWGLLQVKKKGLRDMGATLSPSDAHLISVGMDTLALRQEKQCANAKAIATFVQNHPLVKDVYYPALSSHPQHEQAKKMFKNFGSIFSFSLKNVEDCLKVINRFKVLIISSNLGDVRSLCIPVAKTIFYEIGETRRQTMGIDESMIRVSMGIENTEDLLKDFKYALNLKKD